MGVIIPSWSSEATACKTVAESSIKHEDEGSGVLDIVGLLLSRSEEKNANGRALVGKNGRDAEEILWLDCSSWGKSGVNSPRPPETRQSPNAWTIVCTCTLGELDAKMN